MGTPRIVSVLAGMLFAALAAGCDKKNEPPKPTAAVQSTAPANQSVALPQNSLPQSDAAIPPQAPPATPSPTDASNQSQASPKELDKSQESAAMPMPGQVNNHSTPEPLDPSQKK